MVLIWKIETLGRMPILFYKLKLESKINKTQWNNYYLKNTLKLYWGLNILRQVVVHRISMPKDPKIQQEEEM